MDELSLYENILGLCSPWQVEQVKLDEKDKSVHVYVGIDHQGSLKCPQCGKSCPGYDHRPRRWRHLDTCQYKTFVKADVPRVKCEEHGCLTIAVPWAEERSRYTLLFESLVIDWLGSASISAVCDQMRMSWNAVDGIMQRAVARGQSRLKQDRYTHICIDEVSILKHHEYMTIISKPNGQVIAVEEGKSKGSLKQFYDRLNNSQKQDIEVISMDMSPAYLSVSLEEIPDAKQKIAFDRFHVAQWINKAVDTVRKQESRQLHQVLKDNDLLGNRFIWLKHSQSLSSKQDKLLTELRRVSNKTGRAWLLKEYARSLWDYHLRGWAERAWNKWYSRAIRSQLDPMKSVARSIKKNLWGIINAIVLNASNGIAEAINSKIKMIKVKARGYRNNQRFRTAILFHCGGLSMHP